MPLKKGAARKDVANSWMVSVRYMDTASILVRSEGLERRVSVSVLVLAYSFLAQVCQVLQ